MTISKYAKTYTERYGWHLVPIEPMRKFPVGKNWGEKTLNDPASAYAFWEAHPDYNMGVELGTSGMCSLDIDDAAGFAIILDEFGIDITELDQYPTIQGKGKRLMFRVPNNADLPYCKVNWPNKNDPSGEKHRAAMRIANDLKNKGDTKREKRVRAVARRWQAFTVVELRAGTDGKQRQDCTPPSIHPDTGKPYQWIVKPPNALADWPTPPAWLLAIWQNFDKFKPQMQDACPWVERPIFTPPPKQSIQRSDCPDVAGAYNQANDIHGALTRYGYQRKGKRYLSPHSGTGLAGVHILDSERCYIHHASDPLCSVEGNNPVSSFDLYVEYEHNGDRSKAFKQAAQDLGINLSKPKTNPPSQSRQPVATDTAAPSTTPVAYTISAADLSPLIHTTSRGKPLAHIDNVREICSRLGVTLRYNVISKDEEIIIPNEKFSIDNESNASLAWLLSECSLYDMPTAKLPDFITYLSDKNPYNPVVQWVSSTPWDGQDRLTAFLNTVTVPEHSSTELKDSLITKWMISAIAGAFNPTGVSAHGVLTFQGEQYVGKTKWFKSLVPEQLNLTKDGVILRPDDRDSVKQAVSFWLVELGELDSTFRKSDVAQLKAFITQDKDVLRRAYARKESNYARRTVFFASVNPKQFLHDPTGNRRYWTVEIEAIDHSHDLDMQQVWAQVYEQHYKTGATHFLSNDEYHQLNSQNEDFTVSDPIEETIQTVYDWEQKETFWRWKTSTEILKECGFDRPNKADTTACGLAVRKLNNNRGKRSSNGRVLFIPELKMDARPPY